MTNLWWWWVQSGSLFAAYLFICCIVAVLIVYGLNELYLDELESNDDRYPYHPDSYFNPDYLSWYARQYPNSVIQDSILLDYSKLDSEASLKFLASRRMSEPYYIKGPAINRWNELRLDNDSATYTVHWKSFITGHTGQGTGLLTKQIAQQYADELNIMYFGDLIHWIEP